MHFVGIKQNAAINLPFAPLFANVSAIRYFQAAINTIIYLNKFINLKMPLSKTLSNKEAKVDSQSPLALDQAMGLENIITVIPMQNYLHIFHS